MVRSGRPGTLTPASVLAGSSLELISQGVLVSLLSQLGASQHQPPPWNTITQLPGTHSRSAAA